MTSVRRPAVAGMFYPDRPARARANRCRPAGAPRRRQAGASTQGADRAACGLRLFGPRSRPAPTRSLRDCAAAFAVWCCSAPRIASPCAAWRLPEADRFATPLGEVPLGPRRHAAARRPAAGDRAALRRTRWSIRWRCSCRSCSRCSATSSCCRWWWATPPPAEVAEVLEKVWGGDETLIVISSDLSHYLPDAVARKVDGETGERHPGAELASRPRAGLRRHAGQRPAAGGAAAWPARGDAGRAQLRRHRRRAGSGGRLRLVSPSSADGTQPT